MANFKNLEVLSLIVKEQYNLLGTVLQIEKNKNEILVQGKLSDFSSVNNELIDVINKVEDAEKRRHLFIANLVSEDETEEFSSPLTSLFSENEEGNSTSPLTFSMLLDLIKETPIHTELAELYENIKKIVDEIKYYTSINRDLIEAALNVLNITLSEEKKDIDFTGKTEHNHTSSLLVNKII